MLIEQILNAFNPETCVLPSGFPVTNSPGRAHEMFSWIQALQMRLQTSKIIHESVVKHPKHLCIKCTHAKRGATES